MIDQAVEEVLAEYEARELEENALFAKLPPGEKARLLDEFLLPVGRDTGQLLNILAREARARSMIEVGTSYGYSTIWLAAAARETGGTVVTLENHPGKVAYAREALGRAGLAEFVDFRLGDALESLAALEQPTDFVLLDLWKELYIPCFDLIYPRLAPDALIFGDNMLQPERHRSKAEAYRRHVRGKPGIESILLTVGSGLEVSRYCGMSSCGDPVID